MTLTHKLKKALRPQTYLKSSFARAFLAPRDYYRTWAEKRRKQAIERRKANLTAENILRGVDMAGLESIRQRYSDAGERPDVFWTKYLDYPKWLALNARYANDFGLVNAPPRHVLDLGCGGGYFLVVCRQLGAKVVGMDLDKDKVLNDMVALFKLNRITWRIRAFLKLPAFRQKFDLITAFMICFNFPPKQPVWGPAEWDFLLTDLAGRLTPKGRVILGLNKEEDGKLYDEALRSFFESRGADINGKLLTFQRDDLVRTIGAYRHPTVVARAAEAGAR